MWLYGDCKVKTPPVFVAVQSIARYFFYQRSAHLLRECIAYAGTMGNCRHRQPRYSIFTHTQVYVVYFHNIGVVQVACLSVRLMVMRSGEVVYVDMHMVVKPFQV